MSESENKAITILNRGKHLKQNTIPRIKKLVSVKTEISNSFKSNRTCHETEFSKNAASVDRLLELYKDSLKEAVKYREKLDDERSRRSKFWYMICFLSTTFKVSPFRIFPSSTSLYRREGTVKGDGKARFSIMGNGGLPPSVTK